MPQVSYSIRYENNSDLLISVQELRSNYLFGIDIKDVNGKEIDDIALETYIEAAQKDLEDYLNLKFKLRVVEESRSYIISNWRKWNYLPTTYPVKCPIDLVGFLGTTRQIRYPKQWLSSKQISDGELYQRRIQVVPSGDASTNSFAVNFRGVVPHVGVGSQMKIPNYWRIKYLTGFDKVPSDIINIIGKMASFGPLGIAGDLLLGAGIASQSLSIDGLSQSINTTSSAENAGYGARIRQYERELKTELPRMRDRYVGINFGVA